MLFWKEERAIMAERKIIRLMENWTFTGPEGTKQQVNLPHTWNARDGQDGGDDYFRGTCVYEKEIPKPEFQKGERVYLQFHGVNASVHVLLNGKKVCSHHNGYSTFRADVTKKLKDNNLLRVEVDNSKNERVYPQVADFTFYGGIYREVEFLIVSENHFELDYYGGPGIKISTDVKGTDGFVTVQTYVAAPQPGNGSDEKDNLTVELTLKDAEGTVVAQSKGTKAVFKVEQPHLWNGVKDPYLYRVTASLKRGEELLDQITSACGIRTFSVDPKRGFFLNGVSYPLRGVSRHQDWKGIGNAISREQMEQDMELIREVGANTIRLAHYQHLSLIHI